MSGNNNDIYMSQKAKKRIFLDTKELYKYPMNDMGIYYQNDEDDISIGYALIVGPDNTPYHYGYYMFQFKFPIDYPFRPPIVSFLTNDGTTRYNPNLYRNGKVCLSMLNTWDGPSWQPCQTIRSTLLSILTNVFVDNPITNEPGVLNHNRDNTAYNEIIRFKNLEFACLSIYKNNTIKHRAYDVFLPTIQSHFKKNYESIVTYSLTCCNKFNSVIEDLNKQNMFYKGYLNTHLYKMSVRIDYETVINGIAALELSK